MMNGGVFMHKSFKREQGRKGRINIKEIQDFAEFCGWKLISTSYKNQNEPLTFTCPRGHRVEMAFCVFKKTQTCNTCLSIMATGNRIEENGGIVPKKKGIKRLLSIDQATNKTGYAVFDGNKLIFHGVINASSTDDHITRINHMKKRMLEIMENWKVDLVAFEDIPFKDNIRTHAILNQNLGALQCAAQEKLNGKTENIVLVSNQTWKHHSGVEGIYRAQHKASARRIVLKIYNVNVSEDESDAILLGRYVAERVKPSNEFINFR